MRDCGSCNACCYYLADHELDSKENEYCKYCIPGKGCSIWNSRPQSCKEFGCLWWKQPQIPADLRPDLIDVMFELPAFSKVMIGYVTPGKPDAWKEPKVRYLIGKIILAGHPVVLYFGPGIDNIHILPEGTTIIEVLQDLAEGYRRQKGPKEWPYHLTQQISCP